MARNPAIKSTADLWDYYFTKVNQLLKGRGLFLSGWEEIGLRKVVQNGKSVWAPNPAFISENFRVNVWQNSPGSGAEDLAYRMANAGYKVILTNVTHLYIDLAYNSSSDEPGQYWGGYVDIDKPFYFIPYDYLRNLKDDNTGQRIDPATIKSRVAVTEKGKANLVGIESPLWSETNRSTDQFEYKLLPKLLAVAERAWAKDPTWATEANDQKSEQLYGQAWSEFIHTVGKRELPRLDTYAGGFQYRIPAAGAKVVGGKLAANVQFPGLTIRYTTDGTEPTKTSPVYVEPLALGKPIKLRVFNSTGRAGQTVTIGQ
jgi:hexosaminidase